MDHATAPRRSRLRLFLFATLGVAGLAAAATGVRYGIEYTLHLESGEEIAVQVVDQGDGTSLVSRADGTVEIGHNFPGQGSEAPPAPPAADGEVVFIAGLVSGVVTDEQGTEKAVTYDLRSPDDVLRGRVAPPK